MDKVFEILKFIAGIMSSVIVMVGFFAWTLKPVRRAQAAWVNKETHTVDMSGRLDKIEKSVSDVMSGVNDIKHNLDTHIAQNVRDIGMSNQAQMLSLRCQIREIYMRNHEEKTLTVREQRDIHDLYAAYKALGGNGYVLSLLEEMSEWDLNKKL